jgi:hypothetical protein
MIFPSGVVVTEAVTNFWAGSMTIFLLSVSQSAPRGQERALGGVLVFLGTYRIL